MPGDYKHPSRPWLSMYKTKEWWRLRYHQLRKQPLCEFCSKQGIITEATVVDHRIAHKGDYSLFYDPNNLSSLCKLHHDSSKQKMEKRGVEIGCDENGIVEGWK